MTLSRAILTALAALALAGCGVKGDPLTPSEAAAQTAPQPAAPVRK
jgi:predicted small lipoprotein YifL